MGHAISHGRPTGRRMGHEMAYGITHRLNDISWVIQGSSQRPGHGPLAIPCVTPWVNRTYEHHGRSRGTSNGPST